MNKDNAHETTKDEDMDDSCPPHLLEEKILEMIHDDDITPFILMQNAGDLGWDIPTAGHLKGSALSLTFTNETHGSKDLSFDFQQPGFNQTDMMTLRGPDGTMIASHTCVGTNPVDFWQQHIKSPVDVHLHWVHYEVGSCYWNLLATDKEGLNVWAEKHRWIDRRIFGEVLFVPKNWVDYAEDCTAFPVLPPNKM